MKKNVLFRTNVLVCIVIIVGFLVTSAISYRSNQGIFEKDMESVSKLTSQGIYHQIDSAFEKPINVSLTMANDSLLKRFLKNEDAHQKDAQFISTMQEYLNAYRNKYKYDSVFLASTGTKRYYYYNGLDRILEEGDPENVWFYDFLEKDTDYGIQIDNDQVDGAGNEVTVFINCRIMDEKGKTMGVVGVGFRVNFLQSLLKDYENDFGISAYLTDESGSVEISGNHTRFEGDSNLFEGSAFEGYKDEILNSREETKDLWYSSDNKNGYIVSRYIENLHWYLIIDSDTTVLNQRLALQLFREIFIVVVTIVLVLITITSVIRRYNKKIIELTVATEKAHQSVFQQATEQLYEDIYEMDITHDCAASEATAQYFESLGVPKDIPYGKALRIIAEKQIKEEYREGYIHTFDPVNVLDAFHNGIENLQYDFMITTDGQNYYWMRIMAHIFLWQEDNSVRMLVYRQNIDDQKRHELYMMDQMQKDSLTGLYNKVATQEHIRQELRQEQDQEFAFFMIDIDYFKEVNDRLGHAAGDQVLVEFSQTLRKQFRKSDIVGRIGGDEFIAFMPVAETRMAAERAGWLVKTLRRKIEPEGFQVTASIGVAVAKGGEYDFETLYRQADYALYQAKKQGRDRYVVVEEGKSL
ncbi:MAG: diguanylate cyclase [Blautia sp.]|jgi:diguanylate cyclase (GGDEF)-like protein